MTHEVRGVVVEKYALLCQQTSPKRSFGNMEMTSNCDVINSTPNTNDHHITLNHTLPHENFLRTPLKLSLSLAAFFFDQTLFSDSILLSITCTSVTRGIKAVVVV